MKILSISNCPLIESQGSGYIITNFCRGLRKYGYEVDLLGPESYEPFRFIRKAKSYRQSLGILFLVLYKILRKKYDIIEFYGGQSWLAALIINKVPNRSFMLVAHSNGIETHYIDTEYKYFKTGHIEKQSAKWYQLNQAPLMKNAFTQVDAVVTVSENDRNYALTHNYKNESHILAIENPLPNDYLKVPVNFERSHVIGYCGSWLPNKGTQVIKEDIARFLHDFPDCQFKLIGVGTNFKKEDHFPGVVCSQIEVIPFIEHKKDLRQVYQSIAILVAPSFYESFGLVVAEAMACGCAVVASKVGFAANLKNGEEAIVIEEPISPFLYKGVRKLHIDKSLRLRIARAGYQRVQSLCWDLAVDKLEEAYRRWLQEWREK